MHSEIELMNILPPSGREVPIVINLPHSGTFIPKWISRRLESEHLRGLDETDWFLEEIYQFAAILGITTTIATHHRWVVDLNRDPSGGALYDDGRVITGAIPTTTFNGSQLYHSIPPDREETTARISKFHTPYYGQLATVLQQKLEKFGRVLLWDGHSIRRQVLGIQTNPFPDFIIGTVDSTSAPKKFEDLIYKELAKYSSSVTRNTPFKGGNITRSFTNQNRGISTIQLEMCKDLYMKDEETKLDHAKAQKISNMLSAVLTKLIEII